MKRKLTFLGLLSFLIAVSAAANTAPTITAASPIGLTQGDPATSATIAGVSDAEDSAGSLTVTATSVPSGITVSSITNNSGTINAFITVSCSASAGTNNIVLQVTDSGGLTASATFQVNVRSVLPPPIPNITAATNSTGTSDQACPEQPLTLTAHSFEATSYQWYVDGGAISGATSQTYPATSAGSYTVTATNACYTSAPSFIAYTVQNPTPHKANLSAFGPTSFCSGGSVTLWSDSATGIQWYNNGFPISGANQESLVATESGSYTVILNALGCHSSESDPIVVTVSTAPSAPAITANTNRTGTSDQACPEQPLLLVAHDTNSSLTNYQWYQNNDAIDGATSNQYSATAAGDYTIVATLNGCSTRSDAYTVQNPTPHKPTISVLSESTTICTNPGGWGVQLQSDSATGIQWYNNGFPISGANNQNLLATESGSYTVILNALGCHSEESDPVVVTVNTAPETPTITATQNGTGTTDQACPEQPLVLTANDSNPTSTSYQWHVNNDTIDGATSKSYSATGSGDYFVVATSPEGCSMSSATYTVQNPTPHAPFISFRNQSSSVTSLTVCGSSTASQIIDSDSATGIQWYKDGVAISGANSQSYTATTSGTYTARLNALGCHSQFGRDVTLTIGSYPSTPAITGATNGTGTQDQACPEQPLTLTANSSGATSYQWYRDDEPLSETSSTLTVTASSTYYVTATNGTCTTPKSSGYVVQNPTPHAPFISFRNQSSSVTSLTVCGTSQIIDSDSATGIQWYKDGVAISGANSQSYTATTSGTYTAQLNALGCHSQFGRDVTLTLVAYPSTPTITGATNGTGTQDQACPEQPLTLTANSSGATAYQWYRDDELLSGETSSTLTVTARSTYYVTATNGTCTTPKSSGYVVDNPTPHAPFLSARSSTTFCTGGTVTLDSDSATGIQWYKDGVAIPGAGSQSYTATTSGSYNAQLNALGCHSQFGTAITVTVVDYPSTPAITATENGTGTSDQACPEQPLTLTANSSGATAYQWYRDDEPLSETSSTLTVTAASTYYVTATNGTCTTPKSSGYVVQNPTPHSPFIEARNGASTTFCTGGSVLLDSNSATGIQWYKDGVAISGANSQSYTATTSGSYTAQLNALGCHSQFGNTVTVTVVDYPSTPTITGATNGTGTQDQACPEQPLTLTATSSGATAYQWYRDDELLSGETSSTLAVTARSTYYATATNGTCTTAKSSGYFVDNPTPHSAFLSARSATTFCAGGSVILDSNSATGIQWYRDGVAISGAGSQSYTATTSGTYTVILNALGCHSGTSSSIVVTVNPYPATPAITASGATTFCDGGSVTLTSSSASDNQWYLNGTAISGATSQSYTATASGSYTVVVTTNSCSSTSAATTVTVNAYPSTPAITANGATTFCDGGSVVLTSSSASGNQWYLNGTAISGATSQSYTATASGSYTVVVTTSGCSTTSAATTVTVNPYPSTPAITAGGSTSFCSGGSVTLTSSSSSGNQWYLNGTAISGATSQSYTAAASGSYTVVVTTNGCSSTSAATTVTVNANPTATITAPSVVISGSTGNSASVASAGTGASYSWSISNGTITAGSGTSSITFTAGSAGTLTLSVTMTNSNGCSDTKSASVTVVDPVTVTSIKPTSGSSAGGTSVTIKGTNFQSGATVTFGGIAATNVVVSSSTKIFCTTPAHAEGDVDVVVTNTNTASGTLTNGFKYKKN